MWWEIVKVVIKLRRYDDYLGQFDQVTAEFCTEHR